MVSDSGGGGGDVDRLGGAGAYGGGALHVGIMAASDEGKRNGCLAKGSSQLMATSAVKVLFRSGLVVVWV